MKKVAKFSTNKQTLSIVKQFFKKSRIEQIARLSEFVQRKSKLKAFDFMLSLMFARFDSENNSLLEMSNQMEQHFDYSIKKQSIDERFNERTVEFFKQLIEEALSKKIALDIPKKYMEKFETIRIQDSTSFQLPALLKEYYGGCGGNTTGAMTRIQFEYDLKRHSPCVLDVCSGVKQDVTHAKENIGNINENDLIIRDLGYSCIDVFKKIHDKDAFYISKLRTSQLVYIKNKEGKFIAVSFKDVYNKLVTNNLNFLEKDVYLTKNEAYKIRLVVEQIPEDIYNQRIRKASIEAKKDKRQLTEEYKLRARMNIYITNTDSNMIEAKVVRQVYCIRWQIELMFKAWKTNLGIDNVKKMKKERFECQLYAKLLFIIITLKIYHVLNMDMIRNEKAILSYQKFMKNITNSLEKFMFCIINNMYKKITDKLVKINTQKEQAVEMKKMKISSLHSILSLSNSSEMLYIKYFTS